MTAAPCWARCASCSGRTFDGPEPKRPSVGFRASGMASVVVAAFTAGVSADREDEEGAQACGGEAVAPRW